MVLVLGGYASWLNHQFYLRQAPFFDSASYTNYLARVMGATRIDSVKDGLAVALEGSTAPLPGLEAWLLALLHVPVSSLRQLGVWMQVVWLLALAMSLYFYWLNDRRRGPWASVLSVASFPGVRRCVSLRRRLAGFPAGFVALPPACGSGGLVSAYLLQRFADNLAARGMFLALACLNRATAPVYWIVMVGPLLLVRFFACADRKRLLQGVGWMILPAVV